MPERTIGGWPPGKRELTLLDADLLPFMWESEFRLVEPPDVFAARIDQLELQGVHRCVAAYAETQFVVVRQIQYQRAMSGRVAVDCVALGIGKIEIQAQCFVAFFIDPVQRSRHIVGVLDLPKCGILKIVQDRLCKERLGAKDCAQQQETNAIHPLTPPSMSPWM